MYSYTATKSFKCALYTFMADTTAIYVCINIDEKHAHVMIKYYLKKGMLLDDVVNSCSIIC